MFDVRNSLRPYFTIPNGAAFLFMAITLATSGDYGIHGDELYYMACGRHPAWGYVDHPPLVSLLVIVGTRIFGETMFGLRIMASIAGAVTVLLTAKIARKFGGGVFSQSFAALSICCSTVFAAIFGFFSMNPFDIMLCTLFMHTFICAVENPSWIKWTMVGLLSGAGVLNKYTFLVLGFSLFTSLVITRQWKVLRSPGLYAAGLIALVMFLPHVLWQMSNGWPTLEFMRNATGLKNIQLSPVSFFVQLIIGLNPFTLPVWLAGISFLLFSKRAAAFRFIGWTVIIFVLVYILQRSKFYYVVPVFPILLAAGAVEIEHFAKRAHAGWTRWTAMSLLLISGIVTTPFAVPIFPVEQYVSYAKSIGMWNMLRMEKNEDEEVLPIHLVHRMGWEKLVGEIAKTYRALPQSERDSCAILASWYGIAGAVDYFGPALGLPPAICPHNSYWSWGTGGYAGNVVLAVG
jgi:hypothetical protein